ncbi:MAG: alkylated DNA repair dioxygenase [Azorhizobium sp. 12-66-6]|nr:MAG: alkylated DNA repair dioxygenase [Azorhizobium sp. 12-66-6]
MSHHMEVAPGCLYWPEFLDRSGQEALVGEINTILAEAPLFTPRMPRTGKAFSVRMSNCGPLGWVLDAWNRLTGAAAPPQACLINWYAPDARMSLHQDRDEHDFTAPVLSLSLGDTALFRLGGTERRSPTRSLRLASGDALLLSGESRLAFHGIDRILPGTSTLLPHPGRFNLTLRRVDPAELDPAEPATSARATLPPAFAAKTP